MERPEQFKSRKEWEDFLWQKIIKEIDGAKSSKSIQDFLESLIGEYEKKLIIRRLSTMLLLREGLNYRDIGEILWISPNTVSAIKKSLTVKAQYPSRRKYHQVNHPEIERSGLDSFIEDLENFVIRFHKGYSDPKYRWKFLHKQ